jgi:pyruvate dehydrogenase E2 component (dihydrolipoamide acetyltransferase)
MSAAANVVEVRVPDLGSFKDVAVIDVMVKPGDSIEVDTPLVTLESDKAAMDVPSTASGVVEKVHATKGGTVNTGDLLATLKASGGAAQSTAAAAPPPATAAPSPAPPPPTAGRCRAEPGTAGTRRGGCCATGRRAAGRSAVRQARAPFAARHSHLVPIRPGGDR